MATRRRIGVSAATTEAARRQLMQPVPCWEKVWVVPETVTSGTTLKVYKWVKTEKIQQFSDDEGEVDEPLAPLPDEPEVIDGDDEMEQDDPPTAIQPESTQMTDPIETNITQDDLASKPSSPKPQLSMSLQPSMLAGAEESDALDASLKPLDTDMDGVDAAKKDGSGDGIELDISALGPDGLGLESSHDLSQLDGPDALIGGAMMDQSTDPFAETG
ncbi:hypothetical protein BDQ12DRAFT_686062 [Crucibulum laeve]|uniref:Uncharacterized protein n=1 Tax=Crucibulum laeve TaxID=68775 RepID=A0A5C3LVR8_9AGAR|nr:hypothetical protein BDQ12DRAFT_686062 [Crucibulum laeve]